MRFDYALVGGGLQNGLVVLALLRERPGARLVLIEKSDRVGGNHTWCFHADDVPGDLLPVVEPLVVHRWSGYEVRFPAAARSLTADYACVTADRFGRVVAGALARAPGCALITGVEAVEVGAERVVLADGRELTATAVIDARGPQRAELPADAVAFQKFVGLELELDAPHGLTVPILMDATVPQVDGFRFVYTLPLGPRRLLVEDTYYSDAPVLDRDAVGAQVLAYARAAGWSVAGVARREHGVLPLPWRAAPALPDGGPVAAGYQGGWFHPVTGYSFPTAARLAATIASVPPERLCSGPELAALARAHRKQQQFAFRLNRMLFRWFPPEHRYRVLERFYRLPEPTIRRFYALTLTAGDRARIVLGRPPRGLSWRRALALGGTS